MIAPRCRRLPLAILLILSACCAQAQDQRPLTGAMVQPPAPRPEPGPPPPAAPLPPAASPFAGSVPARPAAAPRREVGDATHALLRMQAEGTYAGRALPVLGDQASRSYQRYLDSFEHPIPERFELTVRDDGGR